MTEQKHEFGFEIHDPSSWTGTVTHKICTSEENLRRIYDSLGEQLDGLEEERKLNTSLYKLAARIATWGWGDNVDPRVAWDESSEESQKIYLLRAQDIIRDGWIHADDLDGKPAFNWLGTVKFSELADVMAGIQSAPSFRALSIGEKNQTMAAQVLSWLMGEAKK